MDLRTITLGVPPQEVGVIRQYILLLLAHRSIIYILYFSPSRQSIDYDLTTAYMITGPISITTIAKAQWENDMPHLTFFALKLK